MSISDFVFVLIVILTLSVGVTVTRYVQPWLHRWVRNAESASRYVWPPPDSFRAHVERLSERALPWLDAAQWGCLATMAVLAIVVVLLRHVS